MVKVTWGLFPYQNTIAERGTVKTGIFGRKIG
jgi:hypothetical protein